MLETGLVWIATATPVLILGEYLILARWLGARGRPELAAPLAWFLASGFFLFSALFLALTDRPAWSLYIPLAGALASHLACLWTAWKLAADRS
jgi:hypothetical protein